MHGYITRSVRLSAAPLLAGVVPGVAPWRDRVWSRALTVAAVSMVLAFGLFVAPAAAVTASITLKPGVGPPTTKVSVTGTGFGASETVAVDFGAAQVATAATSSTGTFSTTFTVPKSALPGRHPVTATGDTSGISATHNFLVRTDWAKSRFDLANSVYNPYENVIGPSNVSGLKKAWTAATDNIVFSSPVVANGVAYVNTDDELYAFSAAGTTGCSGTPKTCKPLWTAAINGYPNLAPAVANGVVYIGSSDGDLYAFSAAGTTGCSGTPPNRTCTPLWAGATNGGVFSSAAVVNGVVYVMADKLYAFSAGAGSTHCSGTPPNRTCTPLWTGDNGGPTSLALFPAVANA